MSTQGVVWGNDPEKVQMYLFGEDQRFLLARIASIAYANDYALTRFVIKNIMVLTFPRNVKY
jgi:hypothetical protein